MENFLPFRFCKIELRNNLLIIVALRELRKSFYAISIAYNYKYEYRFDHKIKTSRAVYGYD